MQTSIEWLIESIKSLDKNLLNKIISIEEYDINLKWVIQQAKEMHKQEIIEAFWSGSSHWDSELEAEQYYNETFKKDAKDGLYHNTSHRGNPRPDDVEKFEQDAWDNYEHVEGNLYSTTFRNAFKLGYKKAQETLYTEEEVIKFAEWCRDKAVSETVYGNVEKTNNWELIGQQKVLTTKELLQEFLKSLKQHKQ